MKVAIIEDSDVPEIASFVTDKNGCRLIFESYEDAEDWLMDNAQPRTCYRKYGDDDD